MIDRLFRRHPREVGETWGEHFLVACGFGWALARASAACFAHALVPALCRTTGSRAITRLHARMVANRAAASPNTTRHEIARDDALLWLAANI